VITVHDGFTLNDLVSYNDKHNEANAEDNRDGESHNRSWNCGAEGADRRPEILAFRERQKRNFLTTLFSSRGVPLLLGGDEMSRTQGGNNNAYCQDNEISWFDWSDERRNDPLIEFTRAMIRLRRELPVLRRNAWLTGQPTSTSRRDIGWYSVWGLEMTEEEWTNPAVRCVAAVLDARFAHPQEESDRSVLLVFNATGEDATFTLPEVPGHTGDWALRIYTGEGHFEEGRRARRYAPPAKLELLSHSMALLTQAAGVKLALPTRDAFRRPPHAGGATFRLWAPAAKRPSSPSRPAPRAAPRCIRPRPTPTAGGNAKWPRRSPAASTNGASTASCWCRTRPRARTRRPAPAQRGGRPGQFEWDGSWKGRPWHETVLYELHVGTFTPEGTFARPRRGCRNWPTSASPRSS
jgi:pullulanase/glycogen debranching enzyme